MRWQRAKHQAPKPGDERDVRRFLFLPITIGGVTRWLEWATLREKFVADATWELLDHREEVVEPLPQVHLNPRWYPVAWRDLDGDDSGDGRGP